MVFIERAPNVGVPLRVMNSISMQIRSAPTVIKKWNQIVNARIVDMILVPILNNYFFIKHVFLILVVT